MNQNYLQITILYLTTTVENSFESLIEETPVMSQTERTRRHRQLGTSATVSDPELHGTLGDAYEGIYCTRIYKAEGLKGSQ